MHFAFSWSARGSGDGKFYFGTVFQQALCDGGFPGAARCYNNNNFSLGLFTQRSAPAP